MSVIKKYTPNRIKIFYHKLRFNIDAFYVFVRYRVRSVQMKGSFSQHGQDVYLRDVLRLQDRVSAIVEIGANRPDLNSNSKIFDEILDVVSVDPINYYQDYRLYRPNVTFVNLAIDLELGIRRFYKVCNVQGWEDQMSSFVEPDKRFIFDEFEVHTNTLGFIVENYVVSNKKYALFIDVEGWEKVVLTSLFESDSRIPDYILIEMSVYNSDLHNLLIQHGFEFIVRLGKTDSLYALKIS
jgi:hypothetical protein